MKRKICLLLALAALCALMLCACGQCEHDWKAATCDTPKTCRLCDQTEGAPLGHEWYAATCEKAKTCSVCGYIDGEALGHQWADATCETPQTCTVCNTTQGEALGHVFAEYMDCENPPKCGTCGISSAEPTAHTWVDANCDTAKTCSVCAATEGAPLGHEWYAATCEKAKTCAVCGVTDGEALGHNWSEATCVAPKTCASCGTTDGQALGHTWADATTEAPKTCTACGATEGEKIVTDSRFTTAACKELFGDWYTTSTSTYTSQDGVVVTVPSAVRMSFTNDGHCQLTEVYELEAYKAYMQIYLEDYLYAYYGQMGYTKESLNDAMLAQYGMNVHDYVANTVNGYTQEDATSVNDYVYYAANGVLYLGSDWTVEFGTNTFTVDGDTLNIQKQNGGVLVLTRDPEISDEG